MAVMVTSPSLGANKFKRGFYACHDAGRRRNGRYLHIASGFRQVSGTFF